MLLPQVEFPTDLSFQWTRQCTVKNWSKLNVNVRDGSNIKNKLMGSWFNPLTPKKEIMLRLSCNFYCNFFA
jgi:hypothetical protein